MQFKVTKEFNDLALRRTKPAIKNGIDYDKPISDMLAHAYLIGFVDSQKVSMEQPKTNEALHD